ncbi:unnamed protein product, partial [Rotaria magnacalcarata]
SSSTRSRRSINLNDDDDDIANFFIPNKQNLNNIRQQSVQKAMKYLRENKTIKSTNKKLLKRIHATTLNTSAIKENDELLAETILSSSKSPRIRKKLLNEDLCSDSQTSTPLLTRQLLNKKSFTTEPLSPRMISESDNHPIEELS